MTPPSSPPAVQFPIKVKYNHYAGIAMLIVGVSALIASIQGGANLRFTAVGLILLGVAFTFGTSLIVDRDRVRVLTPVQATARNLPIEGLQDLYFVGNQLFRASDDRRVVNLGWGSARPAQLAALKEAVEAAGGQRRTPEQPA